MLRFCLKADELCFHLDERTGNVNMLVNGQMITECLFNVDLTQRLYFFFDLVGKTNAIRLISECQHQITSQDQQQQQQPQSIANSQLKRRSALIDFYKSQLVSDKMGEQHDTQSNASEKRRDDDKSTEECRICWDAPIECVFYSCGHMCLCWNWYV